MSDLLPPNASAQERAMSATVARLGDVPPRVRDVWDPDTCPRELLAWLAWAFSVDEWDTAWTDAQKRETIRRAVLVHKYKGTIGAVRDALDALGVGARVQEWFSQTPVGDPYTFRLLLESRQDGVDVTDVAGALGVVERTKNLRSHLEEIQVIATSQAGPTVAAYTCVGSEITVKNYVLPGIVVSETAICA